MLKWLLFYLFYQTFTISCDNYTKISDSNKKSHHCKEIVTMSTILEQPGMSILEVPADPIRSAGTARSIIRNSRTTRTFRIMERAPSDLDLEV